MHGHKNYKLLPGFYSMFPLMLALSNILAAAKITQIWSGGQIGPLSIPAIVISGGTLLFPITYLFGDIFTEVYGYAAARKAIWYGFTGLAFTQFFIWVVSVCPPAPFWQHQAAYEAIFAQVWRINIGSVLSYFVGEFANSYTVSKMKVRTGGKGMGFRFIASTVVGQFFDTMIFLPIAFAGVVDNRTLFVMFLSNWSFKVIWEIVALPVTLRVVPWVKRFEHEDHFDRQTDFNPLHVNADG